jgi:hypothetical protein
MQQLPLLQQPPPFCAYASGECDQTFRELPQTRGLFLYAAQPAPIASAMASAAEILRKQTGDPWSTWRDLDTPGHIIFCEICKAMRGAAAIYADVTTLNFNLLFEIGFAIGLGVPVRPVRDPTYSVDKKWFDALGILDSLGYLDFTNAPELAAAILDAAPPSELAVPPKRTYRESPLYVLKGPIDTDGSIRLMSLLKKSRIGFRAYDPKESSRISLSVGRKNIRGSFGVVAYLLSPNREGAPVHNALCAFLCGMAVAEQKPVLMLQEEPVTQPLDYRDLVQHYESPDDIEILIQEPLRQVIERLQSSPEVGRAAASGILEQLDLGDTAAENEIHGLREYFVPTGRFQTVRQGHAKLVVGRKGAGKTAMFYGLRQAVRRGREVLVLDMKPEGHQFTRLREAVLEELTTGQQEYTIAAFWTYLLSAEVAHKILNDHGELHSAEMDPGSFETYKALEDAYLGHGLASGEDLSQRLLRQIDRMSARFAAQGPVSGRTDLAELVYGGDLRTLNDAVAEYLVKQKDEVWLLIDNLDKSWATRGSTAEDMLILRGLLDASQRLQRQLEERDVTFRSVVFIRADVLDHLVERTPDRGKDSIVSLDWDDPETFREIVFRRVVASTELTGDFKAVWPQIAPPLMGVEDTFMYLLDRTLMRPRDLLMFLGDAVQVAIDRGHDHVEEADIRQAEIGYSEDMLLGLIYEIEDTRPEVAPAAYGFYGVEAPLKLDEALARIVEAGVTEVRAQDAMELLLWYGFLGVRMHADGSEQYSFQVRYNLRRLLHALRTGQGSVVVHPAFRVALGSGGLEEW